MKKILYPLSLAAAVLFTACSEDRGTSTEAINANRDEQVNPNHINQYNLPGTAGASTAATTTDARMNNTGNQAGVMAQNKSAVDLVYAYYNKNKPEEYYNFNATNRMAGMADDTATKNMSPTGGVVNKTGNQNPGGKTDPNSRNNNTTTTSSSTTADMQSTRSTDGGNRDNREEPKTTGKKNQQKKERLTPYNDRNN